MPGKSTEAKKFPYLLVDEGLKKNQASERLRIFLGTKINERAELEIKYIKGLQAWVDDLIPPMEHNDGADCYMDSEIVKRIMKSLRTEGNHVIDEKTRLYNHVMAEDGPYTRITIPVIACKDSHTTFYEMKEEFSVMRRRRKEIEKDIRNHTEAREHVSHQIEDMDSRLAHTSRITTTRRPQTRGGTRKVDEMRNRLSVLRHQKETGAERIDEYEHQLLTLQESTEATLLTLDRQLQELENIRIKAIVTQIKLFLNFLHKSGNQRSPGLGLGSGRPQQHGLESVDGLLKVHWVDVRSNAKRSEQGEQFKLREMFAVQNSRPQKADVLMTQNQPGRDFRNERKFMRNNAFENNRQNEILFDASQTSISSSRNSLSDSNVSLDYNNVRGSPNDTSDADTRQQRRPPTRRDKPVPVATGSQGSIESVQLPPEVRCPAELTNLEPNKQYAPRMKVSKRNNDNKGAHFTEYSTVAQYNGEISENDEEDTVSKHRDIKVIAIQDHIAATSSQDLSFRKGQIIKQKHGQDENGNCYGWTRDHRLAKKEYGYYRGNMVQLYKGRHHL